MSDPIPRVTEAMIRRRIDERSFDRARPYARNGSVTDRRRQGATLKANCQGTASRPYRVEVAFAGGDIRDAECSCPVGDGGYCKHVAAVLLTYRDDPAGFAEVESLDAALEKRGKAELIALIKQMVRRQPGLELLLESAPAGGSASADPAVYRRQAAAAFQHSGDEWGASFAVADELEEIRLRGDELLEQGQVAAAAAFAGVAEAVV